ncbi:NF045616 family extracytoplasmic (lipo)protein [Acinetobacter sp. TY1]|uniref:NF045616 family extracytoplasmic (lipo)protein n=1 Tax=Acinetobacter sp. TY1 TaxID=3387626 RepID=UPI003AF55AB2
MIIKKILGISLSLSIVLLFFNGCEYEKRAQKLPLSLLVKNKNICLYTNSKKSFLDEKNKDSYFLIYTALSSYNTRGNNFEKKIMLKEHIFPLKEQECFPIPIHLFELDKPYDFILDTDKNFFTRACVLKQNNTFQIKVVTSTENCDK